MSSIVQLLSVMKPVTRCKVDSIDNIAVEVNAIEDRIVHIYNNGRTVFFYQLPFGIQKALD